MLDAGVYDNWTCQICATIYPNTEMGYPLPVDKGSDKDLLKICKSCLDVIEDEGLSSWNEIIAKYGKIIMSDAVGSETLERETPPLKRAFLSRVSGVPQLQAEYMVMLNFLEAMADERLNFIDRKTLNTMAEEIIINLSEYLKFDSV